MSIYMGNPSFKETRFKKRFGLLGVEFDYYTVFDGKEDLLDYHADIQEEYDAVNEMEPIEGWLGYVLTDVTDLSEANFDKLVDASVFHFFSGDATQVTFIFDWSDVELIEGEALKDEDYTNE